MIPIAPVILCGGSGTSLWPLSREAYPIQFADLGGRTLFKDTLSRAICAQNGQELVIICNEVHRLYVAATLRETGVQATILLEPAPRNTAPAIALAALALTAGGADPLMLVLPSDHALEDMEAFLHGVSAAALLAEQGHIVTFGIPPAGAEIGFDYIETGTPLGEGGFRVARFVENPNAVTAQTMLAQGGTLWNSGMLLMRASVYLKELERFASAIQTACCAAWEGRSTEGTFCRPNAEAFLASSSDSVNCAIMAKTECATVVPLNTSWRALISWEAFYQVEQKGANDNVCHGDIIIHDTANCYFNARHRLVVGIGLRDLMVVETRDALLVASRDQAQVVKTVISGLASAGRQECKQHLRVHCSWGSYETIALGDRFQVKRIIVDPGAELSLQMHHHRAEHWVVVSGSAEVTNGNETNLYIEDQSTYIPIGTAHRLRNPGLIPLVLIEIQVGSYLGEDDIVHFV